MRPQPPLEILDTFSGRSFVPSTDLAEWVNATFIAEGSRLENAAHAHLRHAHIGYLWTNVENTRKGKQVIGQAELGTPQGVMGKWARARAEEQIAGWFGAAPDFIITIDANWWMQASDAQACALIEHELSHCAQDTDDYGAPRFNKQTGMPVFTIRGHDVEAFIGVAARYGAIEPGVRELMDVLSKPPVMTADMIGCACGTCQVKAA